MVVVIASFFLELTYSSLAMKNLNTTPTTQHVNIVSVNPLMDNVETWSNIL